MITEELAQEIRREVLEAAPDRFKTEAQLCITTKSIALLVMGLGQNK
jgi:hypothetical protein